MHRLPQTLDSCLIISLNISRLTTVRYGLKTLTIEALNRSAIPNLMVPISTLVKIHKTDGANSHSWRCTVSMVTLPSRKDYSRLDIAMVTALVAGWTGEAVVALPQ